LNKKKKEKNAREITRRKPKGATKGGRERKSERVPSGRKQGSLEHMGRKNGWNWCFKRSKKAGIISCPACR
jgi:hypothetical protein